MADYYDAFISYSRHDEEFARKLEAKLEAYRAPRPIGQGKRLQVFRDVQDLVGNDLPQAIREALDGARHLIVLCSPHSRGSEWVGREIDAFAEKHGKEKIIPALIGGRPNREVAPADEVKDQAFHESLLRYFEEPLAADFRPQAADTRRRRKMRYQEAIFSLLARLFDVEKEELVRRQQARSMRMRTAAVVVALAIALGFALLAVQAWRDRSAALAARSRASSRLLAMQASSLIPSEIDLALLLGVEAQRTYGHAEANSTLLAALQHDARLRTYLRGHQGDVLSLAFSPDGQRAADATASLWDVDGWRRLGEPMRQQGMNGGVAFSPDGKLLAVGSGHNITIWKVDAQQRLASPLPSGQRPWSVAISPDSTRLAAGLNDGGVQMWNLVTRQPLGLAVQALPPRMPVFNAKFSPNGERLALAGDDMIALWDTKTQRLWREAYHGNQHHPRHVPGLAFSPNGAKLASGGRNGVVRLWDADTLAPLGDLPSSDGSVMSIAFSPDGKRLASGNGEGTIWMWDVDRLQPIGEPIRAGNEPVLGVAFIHEGRALLSMDGSGDIQVWDIGTRRSEHETSLVGRGMVWAASFGSTDKWVASLSQPPDLQVRTSIRLWSVASQQALDEPLRPDLDSSLPAWGTLALSPNGKLLASGNVADQVLVWNVDPAAWQAEACRIANRNLSRAEWHRYIGEEFPYHRTCPDLPPGDGAGEPAGLP